MKLDKSSSLVPSKLLLKLVNRICNIHHEVFQVFFRWCHPKGNFKMNVSWWIFHLRYRCMFVLEFQVVIHMKASDDWWEISFLKTFYVVMIRDYFCRWYCFNFFITSSVFNEHCENSKKIINLIKFYARLTWERKAARKINFWNRISCIIGNNNMNKSAIKLRHFFELLIYVCELKDNLCKYLRKNINK